MCRVLHHHTNSSSCFKYFYLFIFIWGAVLGLRGCVCVLWLQQAGATLHLRGSGFLLQPQQLRHRGFRTPRHTGSSCPRDRTRVLCIGRWILNHRTTREVPRLFFQLYKSVTAALSLELKRTCVLINRAHRPAFNSDSDLRLGRSLQLAAVVPLYV